MGKLLGVLNSQESHQLRTKAFFFTFRGEGEWVAPTSLNNKNPMAYGVSGLFDTLIVTDHERRELAENLLDTEIPDT